MDVGPRMTGRRVCSTEASAQGTRDVSGLGALSACPPSPKKASGLLTSAGSQGGGSPDAPAKQAAHSHLVIRARLQVTQQH